MPKERTRSRSEPRYCTRASLGHNNLAFMLMRVLCRGQVEEELSYLVSLDEDEIARHEMHLQTAQDDIDVMTRHAGAFPSCRLAPHGRSSPRTTQRRRRKKRFPSRQLAICWT